MQQMFVSKVFELLLKHKFADFKQKDMYIVSLLRVTYGIISIFFKKTQKHYLQVVREKNYVTLFLV